MCDIVVVGSYSDGRCVVERRGKIKGFSSVVDVTNNYEQEKKKNDIKNNGLYPV